jgi:hypothetical protein
MIRTSLAFALALVLLQAAPSLAGIILFNSDPFEGSTALTTPGRQVVGNELFLPEFSIENDVFAFDPTFFDVDAPVSFFNGPASGLPTGGLNVIVLQDSDNDNNPATVFNAGLAANLIAAQITQPGAGFFIYFNSASSINANRLVYSTDLSSDQADLKILARIVSPTGNEAIAALPTFQADNFAIVPEPSTFALSATGAIGLGLIQLARRRLRASR